MFAAHRSKLPSLHILLPSVYICRQLASGVETTFLPKRKRQDVTGVLNALSKTVTSDLTAPHFKYHDDPYLAPQSNLQKRIFAMAQESGRKAAYWVQQENMKLFQHSEAVPPIPAFFTKKLLAENSDPDLIHLETLINDGEVLNATKMYQLMKEKSIPIPDSVKQSLLELLSLYNHSEPISLEWAEERWFQQSTQFKDRHRETWKNGELFETLLSEIPESACTYASMIRGMCKYFQVERALEIFREAQQKHIDFDIETFNSILSAAYLLKGSAEQRWEVCQTMLMEIKKQKIRPNLGTLNALLSSISNIGNNRLARILSIQTLGEFNSIKVVPSLTSWYYILTIFCCERGPTSQILVHILNEIDGKEFEINELSDTFFFTTAMDVACNHMRDKSTALRINALLHHGKNYDLIGDSYKEAAYYRHFFALLCQTESLEDFMKTYDLLVPNVYTPEPGIMEQIFQAVDRTGGVEHIPKLWSDVISFDHVYRKNLLTLVLKIIADNPIGSNTPDQLDLQERLNEIVWYIFTSIIEPPETLTPGVRFNGEMLGNILYILSRNNDFEKARKVFKTLFKNQNQIFGSTSYVLLLEFVRICINEKKTDDALDCWELAVQSGLVSEELIKKIVEGLPLDERQVAKIKSGESIV